MNWPLRRHGWPVIRLKMFLSASLLALALLRAGSAFSQTTPVVVQKKKGDRLLVIFPEGQAPAQGDGWSLGSEEELRLYQPNFEQQLRRDDRFELSLSYESYSYDKKAKDLGYENSSLIGFYYLQAWNYIRFETGPFFFGQLANSKDVSASIYGIGVLFEFNFIPNTVTQKWIPAIGGTFALGFGNIDADSASADLSLTNDFLFLALKVFPWNFSNVALSTRLGIDHTKLTFQADDSDDKLTFDGSQTRVELGLAAYW